MPAADSPLDGGRRRHRPTKKPCMCARRSECLPFALSFFFLTRPVARLRARRAGLMKKKEYDNKPVCKKEREKGVWVACRAIGRKPAVQHERSLWDGCARHHRRHQGDTTDARPRRRLGPTAEQGTSVRLAMNQRCSGGRPVLCLGPPNCSARRNRDRRAPVGLVVCADL